MGWMCEILEPVHRVLPGKGPGSCESRVNHQQGGAASGAAVSYTACEEEEGKRGADSVQELAQVLS